MYDYFWANRPIWGITNRNPELDQILMARNHYLSHTLEPITILATLETIWGDWQQQTLKQPTGEPVTPEGAVQKILQQMT
jgi:hypothetical protein